MGPVTNDVISRVKKKIKNRHRGARRKRIMFSTVGWWKGGGGAIH